LGQSIFGIEPKLEAVVVITVANAACQPAADPIGLMQRMFGALVELALVQPQKF
jgi:hypothetical protein